ncbi:hypothetical protein GCM10010106_16120 [Thermopolyspora flexuosa]|uniref:Uncharacterized protein n=1 Tax=Thermopolyspora flexuosa TaxID=103836 RepID=A0A543IPC7_9ACTN|nr:hypothetical protein [Thermopolyspora flexuosa]TQM72433.1 hypothetical protein FHX40_4572 [Thermopolyspora flexuosa]GGM70647.1 hypothetical protein GCM10010106_16120 [Thermopolyspora flexuosa]
MADERFCDVSACPDHGQGPIAQAVHGLLVAMGPERFPPTLATVYNTLADPPGPPGYSLFAVDPIIWELAGQDPQTYFALITEWVGAMPPPEPPDLAALGEPRCAPTRLDALAFVFHGTAVHADAGPAGAAIAANLAEGYYRRGDVAASPAAERALMGIAVDRGGATLMLSAAYGPVVRPAPIAAGRYRIGGTIVDGLSSVLAALWSLLERVDAQGGE